MATPAAVRKAAARADALHKNVYGEGPAPVADTPANDAPAAEAPAAAAAAAEAPEPTAQQAQQPQQAPEAPPQPAPVNEKENWEHKYKTVQGMLASQQQRHARETQEMRQQIDALKQMVERLQAAPPAAAPQERQKLITDEELADYGPDLINVVKRAAKEELLPELLRLEAENRTLKEQLSGVTQHVQMSVHDRMYDRLAREVPKWQEINRDPEFLQWLGMVDPYSGQVRQTMLNNAVERADADRVIAFFKGFFDQNAAVDAVSNGTGRAQAQQPQVPLDSLVAPGRPKSSTGQSAQQANGKRVYTTADIQQFYNDVSRGVYRNRPADRARLEEDIIAAGREGRVVR